jgi:hypothetical protein
LGHENLAWDNLIYLAVGRVEYLSQLIRVEVPPLPPEIAQEIEEAKKKRRLEHKLRLYSGKTYWIYGPGQGKRP